MNSAREDLKDFLNESLRKMVLERMSFCLLYEAAYVFENLVKEDVKKLVKMKWWA